YEANYAGPEHATPTSKMLTRIKRSSSVRSTTSNPWFHFSSFPHGSSQDSVTYGHNLGATDIVLIPSGNPSTPPSASVPAHRVVLVSHYVA
ncbi:hypothetical protein PIB30_070238, partial [Stylosanthes scabra]|nr:hypothetical protein [Stylosanthes scabra]